MEEGISHRLYKKNTGEYNQLRNGVLCNWKVKVMRDDATTTTTMTTSMGREYLSGSGMCRIVCEPFGRSVGRCCCLVGNSDAMKAKRGFRLRAGETAEAVTTTTLCVVASFAVVVWWRSK